MTAGAPYSERFLTGSGSGQWVVPVPAGHRAVIKCVTAYNGGTAPGNCALTVNGAYVFVVVLQANTSDVRAGLHIVQYAGENIILGLSGTGMAAYIGGFLFTQTSKGTQLEDARRLPLPRNFPGPDASPRD